VSLVDRGLRVFVHLELDEGVAALHDDVRNLSVLLVEVADVPLIYVVANAANIDLDGVVSNLGHFAVTVRGTIPLNLLSFAIVGALVDTAIFVGVDGALASAVSSDVVVFVVLLAIIPGRVVVLRVASLLVVWVVVFPLLRHLLVILLL
jgi:hypothetical protein